MPALTEQQYRRWSGDTRSRWYSTGNVIGVSQLLELVETEIADYLGTHLQPTQVVNEEHRPLVISKHEMGTVTENLYLVTLHRRRLLASRGISLTWVFHARGTCTETTYTGCVSVLDALLSKVDLSQTATGTVAPSFTVSDYVTVRLTYWCGFESLPVQIQRAAALMARYDAQELIAGSVAMDDDLPWRAPQTQRSDLALFRTLDSPSKYSTGEQGISVFGRGFVGIAAERLCAPFRVFDVRQI